MQTWSLLPSCLVERWFLPGVVRGFSWIVGNEKPVGTVGHHLGAEGAAGSDRAGGRPGGGASDSQGTVVPERDGTDPELVAVVTLPHLGEGPDRGGAAGLELGEADALAGDGSAG